MCQVLHFHLTSFQFAVGLPGYNPFCKSRIIKALCGDQAGKGMGFITGENEDASLTELPSACEDTCSLLLPAENGAGEKAGTVPH